MTTLRISLLRPPLFLLGTASLIISACALYLGGMRLSLLPLAAEVYAHELIADGAINIDRAAEVLQRDGFTFHPDASKETGLGRFIVRDNDLASARWWLRLACITLAAQGLVMLIAAFGSPSPAPDPPGATSTEP